MATFEWNANYSVHVQQFDAQHQKLFAIINQLADAMRAGKGQEVVQKVVEELAVYTRTHFLQEEAAMQKTGYPQLAAHHEQHARLMTDVENYKKELEGGGKPNTVAVLGFLQNWLIQHIQKSDKAYSEHMNAHGVR